MHYSIRRAITVMALAALAGGVPALSHGGMLYAVPAAAGTTQYCPPSPLAGSTINGNLLVTGECDLVGVMVTGSISMTVESSLYMKNSSVGGGISGQRGDVFLDTGSSVRGNISITNDVDLTIIGSTVTGSVFGDQVDATICGSTIRGSINFTDADVSFGGNMEDSCASNTFGGGITLSRFSEGEIENNTIGGSVNFAHTTIDFSSNTVAGNATCTTSLRYDDGDSAPNTVKGSNTCANLPTGP